MSAILRGVYDFQATRQVSDLEGAAREFLRFEKRRTMVVILTQLRPEDREDLLRAHRSLRKRHLVIVASLRESRVQEMLADPVETDGDAWRFGAAAHYVRQREELVEDLRARGVIALDLLPEELPVALASEYLEIKSAGKL